MKREVKMINNATMAIIVSLLSLGFSIWTFFITLPDTKKMIAYFKQKWCWHPAFTQKGAYMVCARCGKGFDRDGKAVPYAFDPGKGVNNA
jgi:hypothetical protein